MTSSEWVQYPNDDNHESVEEVKNPTQYIASLPEERRGPQPARRDPKSCPDLEPHISAGMLGYGRYHYKYASGREGDSAIVSLARQKITSVSTCAPWRMGNIWRRKTKSPWESIRRESCIRFKKLEDLDLEVAMELVRKSAKLIKAGGVGSC